MSVNPPDPHWYLSQSFALSRKKIKDSLTRQGMLNVRGLKRKRLAKRVTVEKHMHLRRVNATLFP